MSLAHQSYEVSSDRRRTAGICVPELVAVRGMANPNAPAVVSDTESLTYRELDVRANHLAGRLRALGVGTDVPVGLCVPRSVEMVVGALAILRAGGAYVPMDPAYPPDRLAFIAADAQAPVVLTSRTVADRLPPGRWRQLCIDDLPIGPTALEPPPPVAPADLAYIIYTSGSTGKPKGVEITHRGLANLVAWHLDAFGVTAEDRASHVAGLGFDAAVWELWPPLVAGASVHLADDRTRGSAADLRDWLLAQRITLAFVPTPLLEHLLTLPWPESADLRIVLTGGDTLHRYPPASLPFQLVNNYGPTECTVVATSGPVYADEAPAMAPSIGRAITNTRIYLLDQDLRPVADGEAGEICIGGPSLARGYHNRADLTAEKFVSVSLGRDPDGRLYRTGDLGRALPDGQIVFLGRGDDQIKIRGYRIEPGEVSSTLNRHPSIRGSLVVAREDTVGDKRLVAYVARHEDVEVTRTELREFLGRFLPAYLVPSAFVLVEDFPLTPHGKIDRSALPIPDTANTLRDEVEAEFFTETEEFVADLLCELLKLEEIGLDDNFFMLGGHSLLGAQVIARLQDSFGVDIGLRGLFEAPTVASLSAEVDRRSGTGR
jgi:amino acid adenylation domain-containing protein